MTIKEQLQIDIKNAMRERAKARLSVLRLVNDRIQKYEKDIRRDLLEDEVIAVVQTFLKALKEEMAGYQKVGNLDRVAALAVDIIIVEAYVPAQLSLEEVEAEWNDFTDSCIRQYGFGVIEMTKKDVMQEAFEYFKGRAEKRFVSQVVNKKFDDFYKSQK